MKKLLIQLLEKWTCKHEWEIFERIDMYDEFSGSLPSYTKCWFMCKKCGKIKKKKL